MHQVATRRSLHGVAYIRTDCTSFPPCRIPSRFCTFPKPPSSRALYSACTKSWGRRTDVNPKTRIPVYLPQGSRRRLSATVQAQHGADPASASPVSTSSVSSSEVDHFSRLASSWWDPHGPSRLLHLMNPLRFDFIQSLFTQDTSHPPKSKRTYLDIGCGGGIFASSCARHPFTETVTAIDPTPACIAVAQAQQRRDPAIQAPKLIYLNTALESLPPTNDGSKQLFDVITIFEVIEHISSPATFLQNVAEHLKPGGWLIGSTIARSPVSYLTTKLIAEAPVIGVVPAGTHDWNQYINPEELQGWFEKQNEIAAVGGPGAHKWADFVKQGVIYVPALGWKVVRGSEKYGNYFFGAQKLRDQAEA